MGDVEKGIISTLCYSSIFNWPLTYNEIYKYLYKIKIDYYSLSDHIRNLLKEGVISYNTGLFCLSGEEKSFENRLNTINDSLKLLKKGIEFGKLLGNTVPGIKFVGISGSIAAGSVGDIDLFIITSKELYKTRFLSMIISKIANKLLGRKFYCLNFFLSENNLEISEKNIYTAREIAQLIPVFDVGIYEMFIDANKWIYSLLPNFRPYEIEKSKDKKLFKNILGALYGFLSEKLIMELQLELLKHKYNSISGDIEINDKICKINFTNNSSRILRLFNEKIKKYGIEW